MNKADCEDCGREYGSEHGFPDLIIPNDAWRQISPNGDEGGLLCPSCICARLAKKGIECYGAFMSGPIRSVSQVEMFNLRWIENCRETLEGNGLHWKRPNN
jgi:hypothetical protein